MSQIEIRTIRTSKEIDRFIDFRTELYKDDPCEFFMPHIIDENEYDKVDPVGAIIGERGSRINRVLNQLNGEKIDVILHKESTDVAIPAISSFFFN